MPLWRGCSRNTRAKGAPLAPPRCLLPPLRAKKAGLIIQFCPPIGHKIKIRSKILTTFSGSLDSSASSYTGNSGDYGI